MRRAIPLFVKEMAGGMGIWTGQRLLAATAIPLVAYRKIVVPDPRARAGTHLPLRSEAHLNGLRRVSSRPRAGFANTDILWREITSP